MIYSSWQRPIRARTVKINASTMTPFPGSSSYAAWHWRRPPIQHQEATNGTAHYSLEKWTDDQTSGGSLIAYLRSDDADYQHFEAPASPATAPPKPVKGRTCYGFNPKTPAARGLHQYDNSKPPVVTRGVNINPNCTWTARRSNVMGVFHHSGSQALWSRNCGWGPAAGSRQPRTE